MRNRLTLTGLAMAAMLSTHVSVTDAQVSAPTLVGTVIDSATGMPIVDVAIYVDGKNLADTTDLAGEFSLGGVSGGEHFTYLLRAGYSPGTFQFTVPEEVAGEIDIGVVLLSRGPPPRAVLSGTVVDARMGQPVLGVSVDLNGQTGTSTNAVGAFRLPTAPVKWGVNVLEFRRIGYAPLETELWVAQQPTDLDFDIELVPVAIPFTEVVVEGERTIFAMGGRERAFYRRRRMGFGHFFVKQDIERIRPRVVTDILRRVPGLRVVRDNFGAEVVRSARYYGCRPLFLLDGARLSSIDDINWVLSPDVIQGIEVYTGPSQIPEEFNQTGAGCGVVVVWTR